MPQKRNPDMCELIRGKTGRVYGHLIAFLSTMKSLPLAYNKDMQEDKEGLFDALDTYHVCLDVFTNMLPTFKINKDKMYEAAQRGFIAATDVADYLVKKGLAFRAAHDIAGQLVAYCTKNNTTLDKVSLAQYKKFSNLFSSDLYKEISLETLVKNRKSIGGPNKECVKNEIKEMLVNI
jgi:argininosuccinate lyase